MELIELLVSREKPVKVFVRSLIKSSSCHPRSDMSLTNIII